MMPEATTDRYVELFQAFADNGAAGAPAWVRELRERAIARFVKLGFPSTRQEEWRFTSVAPIVETPFVLPRSPSPSRLPWLTPLDRDLEQLLAGDPAERSNAVFVNGRFAPERSSLGELPAGVRVGSLAAALATDADRVRAHLGRYAAFEADGFTALATAFLRDGAFIYVPPRVRLERPIELVFVALQDGSGERPVIFPRTLVVLDREARATVVETYLGLGVGSHFTNAVTELVVGDGARLEAYRVQRESEAAYHVATTRSWQGRDSALASTSVALGAALSRHNIGAVLDGSGALLNLNGLSVLRGRQHVDHHTAIEHAQPHCESHELFNGVFDGQARGVFNGRIVVRPGAQRTDSKQTNNNVLLSPEARADSQPQLEIYADDVKCTHGATTGPLDPTALFYLRSRGLAAAEARALLTYGFAAEILARVGVATVRERLDRLVRERLA